MLKLSQTSPPTNIYAAWAGEGLKSQVLTLKLKSKLFFNSTLTPYDILLFQKAQNIHFSELTQELRLTPFDFQYYLEMSIKDGLMYDTLHYCFKK